MFYLPMKLVSGQKNRKLFTWNAFPLPGKVSALREAGRVSRRFANLSQIKYFYHCTAASSQCESHKMESKILLLLQFMVPTSSQLWQQDEDVAAAYK